MQLERNQIECEQCSQNHNSFDVPTGRFAGYTRLALFPEPSDVSGRGSRVTADQVTGSNGASKVGALGKVRTLIFGCKDAAVTTRGWSTPSAVSGFFGEQGQRPFGVNAFDCREAHIVSSQNVVNLNHFFCDANLWNPKNNQREIGKQSRGRGARDCNCNTLAHQGEYPGEQENANAHTGEQPGEFGSEDLHVTTLTRAREVCIG